MSDHLHRSRDDRMLAGVAGGLADLWDADPSLVRIIWALLVIFTGGIALVVYIVMAIVVPEEDGDEWVPPVPPVAPASYTPPDAQPAVPPVPAPGTGTAPTSDQVPPTPAAAPTPTYWMPGSGSSRADARAARRAARREARHDSSAPAIIGVFLLLIGGFFLAREWMPELDWDWFWPAMLIVLGVLLLVLALGRRSDDHGDRP